MSKIYDQPFSKAKVREAIWSAVDQFEKEYSFDPDNGTAQLDGRLDGHSKDVCMAYGAYEALRDLADYLGIKPE